MPFSRYDHCVCAVGNSIYVLGGHSDGDEIISSVLKYEVGSGSWSEVSPMPEALRGSAACVLGDMIYVFGGYDDDGEAIGTVYRYDAGADEWSTCAPVPGPRCFSGACVMDSMVYVVGGQVGDNNTVDSVFRYDPGSDTWSELAPMPAKMTDLVLYVREGGVHASGRSHSFVYDPSSDSWSAGQAMGTPRYNFQACTVKAEVDVFDAMIGRARQRAG